MQATTALVLAQATGLALGIYNPFFWVKVDAPAIIGNGSKDSLLATFHRQRLTWRVASTLAVAATAGLPALWTAYSYPLFVLAMLLFWTGSFFSQFNQRLNVALMPSQPYKSRWFVSWNPLGSSLDRRLWRLAYVRSHGAALTPALLWCFVTDDLPPAIAGPDVRTQALAGRYLMRLSYAAEAAALTLYPLLVWLIIS